MYYNRIRYIRAKNITDVRIQQRANQMFSDFLNRDDYNNISVKIVGDQEITFVFLDEILTNKIVETLRTLDLIIEEKDITKDVIMGRYNRKEVEDYFLEILDDFVVERLTVDMVLDKIGEFGIGSLTEVDRLVLNTSST